MAAFVLAAVMLAAARPSSQNQLRKTHLRSDEEPAAGRFLVASTKLSDPNFRRTVVLLLADDADRGAIGVIVNRRSKVSLARVFPSLKGPDNSEPKDLAFAGGPVEVSTAQALLRSASPTSGMERIVGDVYSTVDKDLIEKSISSGAASTKFRVYLGYAGWAPDQLEAEIDLGAWAVLRARADDVFDDDPDSLWSRLSRKADSEIALNARPTQR